MSAEAENRLYDLLGEPADGIMTALMREVVESGRFSEPERKGALSPVSILSDLAAELEQQFAKLAGYAAGLEMMARSAGRENELCNLRDYLYMAGAGGPGEDDGRGAREVMEILKTPPGGRLTY